MAGLARGGTSGGSRDATALAPGGSSRNAATTFRIPRALRRASGTSGLGTDSAKARARVADGSIEGGAGVVRAGVAAASGAATFDPDRSANDGGRRARGRAAEATVEGWTVSPGGSRGGAHVRRCVGQSARWHAREQYLVALPADSGRAATGGCVRRTGGRGAGAGRGARGGWGGTHISSIGTRTESRTRRTRRPPRSSSPSDEPGPRSAADQSASGHIDADRSRDDATTLGESHGVVTSPRRASARRPGRDARVRFRRRRVREAWRARRVTNPSDATRRTRRR